MCEIYCTLSVAQTAVGMLSGDMLGIMDAGWLAVLSVAAMLSFNVLVLAQQVDRSASFAQTEAAPVQQA